MENKDLTKTEIIDLVVDYNNNDTQQMLYFIENDCNIKLKIEEYYEDVDYDIGGFYYEIIHDNKYSNMEFHDKGYHKNINCIYNYKSREVLITLFELLSDEEIENIKNIILKIKERKKINDNKNSSLPLVKIDSINNNTNTLSNTNNNSNIINIETYSQLRSFIEKNSSIDDNSKQEIINTIENIEKAKDKKDFKSYVDLYSKLLTSLQATLNISPFIIQGFEWLKNLF